MSFRKLIHSFLYDSTVPITLDGRHVGLPDPELHARNEARIAAAKEWLGTRWVGHSAFSGTQRVLRTTLEAPRPRHPGITLHNPD